MEESRYNAIKKFMNGRDVSSSFCDPNHHSEYTFAEFEYVWTEEQKKAIEATAPEENPEE